MRVFIFSILFEFHFQLKFFNRFQASSEVGSFTLFETEWARSYGICFSIEQMSLCVYNSDK